MKPGQVTSNVARSRPAVANPRSTAGRITSRRYRDGADAVREDAVRHLAGDLVHERPDRGEEHPGRPVRMRWRGEHGRHQGVRVELAFELQRRPLVPRRPDRPQREHVLPHPCRRVRPRGAEPLLDMPSHLRPHPQHDTPARVLLQLVGRVRHAHRVAGEGHGDPGPEGHRRRVLGGQRQRQERIVRRLGRPDAVEPGGLGGDHPVGHPGQLHPEAAVDLQRGRLLMPTPMPPS